MLRRSPLGFLADFEEEITFLRSFLKLLPDSFEVEGLLGLNFGLAPRLSLEGKVETLVSLVLLVFTRFGLLRTVFSDLSLQRISEYAKTPSEFETDGGWGCS